MILGGRYAAFTFILQKYRKQSLFVQCAIIVLHLTKSFAAWRRVAAAVFRESGVRSALFREQALLYCTTLLRGRQGVPAAVSRERALLHYQACCADNNTSVPPCHFN